MQRNKSSRKLKKFRLLLDTAFTHPDNLPRLNKIANVKHVRHAYSLPRTVEDEHIYNVAMSEKRCVITQDDGFRKQVKNKQVAVFIVPSYLTVEEMDIVLSDFFRGKNPDDFVGKAIKI